MNKKIIILIGLCSLLLLVACEPDYTEKVCGIFKHSSIVNETTSVYYADGFCIVERENYTRSILVECFEPLRYRFNIIMKGTSNISIEEVLVNASKDNMLKKCTITEI